MKQRPLHLVLAAEAVLLIALSLGGLMGSSALSALVTFPYAQIGQGLRALSLSGTLGDVAAWLLYLALGLLPAAYLLLRAVKHRARAEDALLAILSATLLYALYLFINPADIAQRMGDASMQTMGAIALGCTLDSLLIAYAVLRLLRGSESSAGLYRGMRWLLRATAAVLVFAAFGSALSSLLTSFDTLREANTALEPSALTGSYAFLVLQYLVGVLPYLIGVPIVFAGLNLVGAMEEAPYSDAAADAARLIGKRSGIAVIAVLLSQVALNLLQVLFAGAVRESSFTLSIPIAAILLLLGARLLAEFVAKGKQIKDDNESFI